MPSQLMGGLQVARGTAVTPTLPIAITNDVIPTEVAVPIQSERRNTNNLQNIPKQGSITVDYEIGGELDPISIMLPLYSLLAKYSHSVASTVNTHTFKPADTAAEYTSILTVGQTHEFFNAITDNSYTVDSASINTLNISMPENSMIPWTAAVLARAVAEGSSGESYTAPDGALTFTDYEASISAGGLGSEGVLPIFDLTLAMGGGLVYRHERGAGSSRYSTRVKMAPNGLAITGTFKMSREDSAERTAIKTAYDNNVEQSIVIAYTSPEIVSGVTPYSLGFAFQEVKYTLLDRAEDNNEDMETYTFQAGFGNDADNVIITLVNNQGDMEA